MAAFNVYEQLLLELMNRARLDPVGEAARLGISLNSGLAAGTISSAPKQALAPNNDLVQAARGHSQHMINIDLFAHSSIGDGTPTSRMQAAGYELTGTWRTGENIAWIGTTGSANAILFTTEIADNLFLSSGHRVNTLNPLFREAGTGVVQGQFLVEGTNYNAVMATENFGLSGSKIFVSGVAINDLDGDNFYDVGEARSGISVTVTTDGVADGTCATEAAGGYSVAVGSGTHLVTFSGGGLASPVSATVAGGSENVKVDLAGSCEILSSVTTQLGAGAKDLVLLGSVVANGFGNNDHNTIIGSSGANLLSGKSGNDILMGGAGNDILRGDAGRDILIGGTGADQFDFNAITETGIYSTSRDIIRDFTHHDTRSLSDVIDLSTIDANINSSGNQGFAWLSLSEFSGVAGQLRYFKQNPAGTANDKTIIEGDVNGDKIADFQIELTGLKNLVYGDFIL